jgi:hypothetical protein
MLDQAQATFRGMLNPAGRASAIELCEISMHNLLRGPGIDPEDFIYRANALQSLGKTVLVSSCAEFHRVAAFLNRCTKEQIGIILSIGLLNELFKEKWSQNLAGGLLESFGRLFKEGVSLLVYPWKNRRSGELVTAENFIAPENCRQLYQHFADNGRILGLACADESLLAHTGRDICRMIIDGDESWRALVPEVAWPMAERHARVQAERAAIPPGRGEMD